MRKAASVVAGLALALTLAVLAGAASAQTSPPLVTPQPLPPAPPAPAYYLGPPVQHPTGGQFPVVVNMKPYTKETNGMSLEGFLRYLVFQQTGKWISEGDAIRVIQQQKAQ